MAESPFVIESTAVRAGKTVAVGFWETGDDSSPFMVARFNADGSPDSSFNATGVVTTKVGSCDDQAAGVVIQADGKIVVVGTSYFWGQGSQVTVLRYHADGTLDQDFGDGGIVGVKLGSGYDQGLGLVLQDDGSLVVVVESGSPGHQWGMLRLEEDGRLDESFDTPSLVALAS